MATRKQRGLKERIYLLDAKLDDNIVLSVKGSSNRVYDITISKKFTKCKCMDFSIRKKVCKHMYFIFGRILKNSNILNKITEVKDINENYELISSLIKETLQKSKSNVVSLEYNKTDTCCICFEEFGDEPVKHCTSVCKNTFHTECISVWLSKNSNCPLCRTDWNCSNDPFAEFQNLSIH